MYFNNKTDEIKTILNRLEQLVLKAEQDKVICFTTMVMVH